MPVPILAIIFCASIFLCRPIFVFAANTDIIINEIGAYEASGHEWIEIYNKGSSAVNLSGWKFFEDGTNHGLTLSQGDDFVIAPGEYAIIAQNDVNFKADYPGLAATIFDSSWSTLNESGEEIGLKDGGGTLVESFTYVAATNFSLERKDAGSTDYSGANWKEHPDGNTAGKQNYWTAQGSSPTPTPSSSKIVINEFVSDPNTGENEWIELYNTESTSVDMNGWTLHDGAGQIAPITAPISGHGFAVVELSSSKLNNTGDVITLQNNSNTVVDQVAYGDWDDGSVSNNAPTPQKGNAIARKTDGGDSDNDIHDFVETTTPTKGSGNQITGSSPTPSSPPSPSGSSSGSGGTTFQRFIPRDVVINELLSDPADDDNEFVELFNTTGNPIDLSGWWIEDGSETKTMLEGNISGKSFVIIEAPKGKLNNTGDLVALFDGTGHQIDRVTYGSWDDGNVRDNASPARDGQSLARKIDGQDADNDQYDFAITTTVTAGKPNVISGGSQSVLPTLGSSSIVINELLPNPKGEDSANEFVELKNIGTVAVDIKQWKLGDSSASRYVIPDGTIQPGGFALFKRSQTNIALNNTGGDDVKLFTANDALVDSVKYTGSAKEDESYARRADGGFAWTTGLTPGKENIINGASAAPVISIDVETEVVVGEVVTFDASDTTDPDGDAMSFAWDFADGTKGDGVTIDHQFLKIGLFKVTIEVGDIHHNTSTQKVAIDVKNRVDFAGGYPGDDAAVIEITEIFPNPEGSDSAEFIELFNPTDTEIDISGLKLDDEDGGSRPYRIPDKTGIDPHEYMVFKRADTALALNNTNDAVRLLYADNSVIAEVPYDDVVEGASYARREDGQWDWTATPTPGEENHIIDVRNTKGTKVRNASGGGKSRRVKSVIETTLDKLREQDVGDGVRVSGVVSVTPGVFSSQYFYLANASDGLHGGAQVYMYKKDFPKITIGDRLTVTGEISEVYGETRVKVSEKSAFTLGGHPGDPVPHEIGIEDVGEPFEGQLVKVAGELTELKSSYMWVDDGTEEVKVYFKRSAGIDKKALREGDTVSVTGIVQQTKSGYQIVPRSKDDITKTGVAKDGVALFQAQGSPEKSLAETYLTATAGGLTSILIGLATKVHGSTAMRFARRFGGVALAFIKRKKDIDTIG